MWAVRDVDLCLLRGRVEEYRYLGGLINAPSLQPAEHCDPLTGQNIYATTKQYVGGEEVVMLSAQVCGVPRVWPCGDAHLPSPSPSQLDTLSFFHDSAFGSNADGSGCASREL